MEGELIRTESENQKLSGVKFGLEKNNSVNSQKIETLEKEHSDVLKEQETTKKELEGKQAEIESLLESHSKSVDLL
jgi:hypothetical protein